MRGWIATSKLKSRRSSVLRALARSAALAGVLSACGGASGGSGGLGSAPEDVSRALEAWKARTLKSCSLEEVFPDRVERLSDEPPRTAIDVDLLARKAPGGLMESGTRALFFGEPVELIGTSDQTHEADGLRLEAHRSGSACAIWVQGEVVHEARLAREVPVTAHFDPVRLAEPRATSLQIDPGRGERLAVGGWGLLSPILDVLRPAEGVQAILAEVVGGEASALELLFPGSEPVAALARVRSWQQSPPFSIDYDASRAYAAGADVERLLSSTGEVELEILFETPRAFASAEPELLRVVASERLEDVSPTSVGRSALSARPLGIGFEGRLVLTPELAQTCFLDRLSAIRAFSGAPTSASEVLRFGQVAGPCRVLAPELIAALAASEDARREIRAEALAPIYVPGRDRGGWDEAFISVAATLAEDGQALEAFVDANRAPGPERDALERIRTIRRGLTSAPMVEVYLRPVVRAVLSRMFDGQPVAEQTARDVAAAIERVGGDYSESTLRLLEDLSSAALEEDALAAAQCAQALDDARRGVLAELFGLATEHPSFAGWVEGERSEVLQNCRSSEHLAEMKVSASVTIEFARAEEPKVAGVFLGAERLEALVGRAMDEGWTASTFVTLQEILDFASVSSRHGLCASPSQASMAECVGGLSALERGLLAPVHEGRYGRLARRLAELERAWLSEFSHLGARSAVESAFFSLDPEPLWGSCTNAEFETRATSLLESLERLRRSEWSERFELERSLSAQLADDTAC